MAIWQYYLKVIPQESVIKRFGYIPERLEMNLEAWEKHLQKSIVGAATAPDFEDADTINWWQGITFDKVAVFSSINKLIERCSWDNSVTFFGWKGDENQNQDNDVYIYFEESGEITEFTFRTDLRDGALDFLAEMLAICKQNNWLVMDGKGNLINPTLLDVYESLRSSNATRFTEDPQKFLEDFSNGKNKPE